MHETVDLASILVLDTVEREGSLTMETLVSLLPQLSWSQIFHAVDELSRAGAILLQRRGFEYGLSPGPTFNEVRDEWLASVV